MAKLLINRREFSIGATALLASLSNFPSFAGNKIKVAGIYTVPIQQKWVARLHLALDAAAKIMSKSIFYPKILMFIELFRFNDGTILIK